MRAVELRLKPDEGSFPGVDRTLAETPGVTREGLLDLEWFGDGTYALLYHLSVTDRGRLADVLADHDEIRTFDLVDDGPDRCYCFVHVAERETLSELLAIADEHALLLDFPCRFTDRGVSVTVAGPSEALQAAFAETTDAVAVSVEWTGTYVPGESGLLGRLTERQRDALRTAYDLGFYEKPRRATYEELGDRLGCAPSTANELLRRAEEALVAAALDG